MFSFTLKLLYNKCLYNTCYRAYTEEGGTLKKVEGGGAWPLVLPCSVDSSPPAVITWYKNDEEIDERNVFQVLDGSLYFLCKF